MSVAKRKILQDARKAGWTIRTLEHLVEIKRKDEVRILYESGIMENPGVITLCRKNIRSHKEMRETLGLDERSKEYCAACGLKIEEGEGVTIGFKRYHYDYDCFQLNAIKTSPFGYQYPKCCGCGSTLMQGEYVVMVERVHEDELGRKTAPCHSTADCLAEALDGKVDSQKKKMDEETRLTAIYKLLTAFGWPDEGERSVIDILADLKHLCKERSMDFNNLARIAETHFEEEDFNNPRIEETHFES
jgi:hypothetical protein